MLNDVPLSCTWLYRGCTFICSTGRIDIKPAVGKFYTSLNNIFSLLGRNRNDMMAIHLVKSNCLPALVNGCEVWSLTPSDTQTAKKAWNNYFRSF